MLGAAPSRLFRRIVLAASLLSSLCTTVASSGQSVQVALATGTKQTVTLTDDGSDSPILHIDLPFKDNVAEVSFNRTYMTLPVDVSVSLSTTNATTYPEGNTYSTLYPPENVVPLGPLFQFELPYDAIEFNDDPTQRVIAVAPVLNPEFRGFFYPADPLGVEVRIRRADGSESFSLEEYVAGGVIIVYKGAFDLAYGGNPPDVIRVSVQPVGYSGVLERQE